MPYKWKTAMSDGLKQMIRNEWIMLITTQWFVHGIFKKQYSLRWFTVMILCNIPNTYVYNFEKYFRQLSKLLSNDEAYHLSTF